MFYHDQSLVINEFPFTAKLNFFPDLLSYGASFQYNTQVW